jgi:hypothetical protein
MVRGNELQTCTFHFVAEGCRLGMVVKPLGA